MKLRCGATGHQSPVVNDVFRVCSIAERCRFRDAIHFELTLAAHGKHHAAIAGPQAACLKQGDLAHVHGCILSRRDEPILVVCSLSRLEQPISRCAKVKPA